MKKRSVLGIATTAVLILFGPAANAAEFGLGNPGIRILETKLSPLPDDSDIAKRFEKKQSQKAEIYSFTISATPGGPPATYFQSGQTSYYETIFYHPGGLLVNAVASFSLTPVTVGPGPGGEQGAWSVIVDSVPPGTYVASGAAVFLPHSNCSTSIGVNLHFDSQGLLVNLTNPFTVC